MNLVAERIGDENTSLGLLVIIGIGVIFLVILWLGGRK